jgi:hypothetical protein
LSCSVIGLQDGRGDEEMKIKVLPRFLIAGLFICILASGCYFPHSALEREPELDLSVTLPKSLASKAPKRDYTAVIELNYVEEPSIAMETTFRLKLKHLEKKNGSLKLKGLPAGDLTLTLTIEYYDKGSWIAEYSGTSEQFSIRAKKQAKVRLQLAPVAT